MNSKNFMLTRIAEVLCLHEQQEFCAYENSKSSMYTYMNKQELYVLTRIARVLCLRDCPDITVLVDWA